jgi:Holliday junction resolvase RusA-like endonuclease
VSADEQRCWVFWVPGPPVGKARARVVQTDFGARAYTPQRTKDYEETVAVAALAAGMKGAERFRCFSVLVVAFKTDRRAKEPQFDTCRPDADNIAKSVLDGLGQLLGDDAKVAAMYASKWRWRGPAGVAVSVHAIDPLATEVPLWAAALARPWRTP